jgi:hypothetical protein
MGNIEYRTLNAGHRMGKKDEGVNTTLGKCDATDKREDFDVPVYLQEQAGQDSLIAFSTTSRVSPVSF